ncbi:GLPGLI family protein [Flavobacterium sp. TP390]|uniref:GLPGLI family protein n=1 Tax=Flavobacterium profundi TaxID=1774945 RepID=A0A6I4IS02_9FLAO|nr:GLPGLI family protein [Flavobacterium profundi]MVO08776.1 GLPGLI family protein [Flavobacterium profundi]
MKKIVILFFLVSILCFSQNYSSIVVNYESIVEPIKIDPKNVEHNDLFENINESFTNKIFVLKANNMGFIFKENLKMDADDSNKRMAKIANLAYSISDYFYEKKRNILFSVTNNLNVISNTNYNWELSSETKEIDAYTCYKATYNYKFVTRKGKEVNRLVTAWYTPQINFNYGPNGYMGLPGLILELEYDKTKLVAKGIEFFKEEIKIDFPKNKEVTEEEFLKKIGIN